jgi:hypothetical protein
MDVIQKRRAEQVLVDIDCSRLLSTGETISSVSSIAADAPATDPALTFGSGAVNVAQIAYEAHTAPAGTVVQVIVSGGAITAGMTSRDYTCRCRVVTNKSPLVEAVFVVRVDDEPGA